MDPVQQGLNGLVLKADIGDAGEQSLLNERVRLRSQQIGAALRSPGQADQRPGQGVLQKARPGGLPTDAGSTGAAGTSGSLFALETK